MKLVAHQLIVGINLIESHDERLHTAAILLRAGKQQITMSTFEGASRFFDAGLSLLDNDCWPSCYDLSLDLHNAAAEVCYVLATFERLDTLAHTVCKCADTFDDTIQIHATHVYSLGSQNMLQDAIDEGL